MGAWGNEDERVLEYLRSRSADFGEPKREVHHGGLHFIVRCPHCGKQKFYINSETSQWDCKYCGETGNLRTLKRTMGDVRDMRSSTGGYIGSGVKEEIGKGGRGKRKGRSSRTASSKTAPKKKPPKDAADKYHQRLMKMAEGDQAAMAVWAWLTDPNGKRGFNEETIKEFQLGVIELDCPGDSDIQKKQGGARPAQGRRARKSPAANHKTDGKGDGGACKLCGGRPGKIAYCVIPFIKDGELLGMKYRSVSPWPKHWRRFPGAESTLLRIDKIDIGREKDISRRESGEEAPPLVLIEGEWDVMAMWQMGWDNTTTFPTGAGSHVRDSWMDQFSNVKAFLVCYDNDGAGRLGAERVATELGKHRCWLATLPEKDANDCLVKGLEDEVQEALANASSFRPSGLLESSSLREEIWQDLHNPDRYYGLSTGWPSLDALWGGVRPGLTLITGHSGSGKTTLTTAMAINLARSGQPGLICPFESRVKPGILKALRMIGRCDPASPAGKAKYGKSWEVLDQWPLFWFNHYGSLPLITLKESVTFAALRLGIRWCVLDHLDFFVQKEKGEREEWHAVKRTLQALVEWGKELSVAFLLVAHPTGKPDNEQARVQMTDLRGGSAAWQIPESILCIHRPRTKTRRPGKREREQGPVTLVSVVKCRNDVGSEGEVPLDFNVESQTYRDPADDVSVEVDLDDNPDADLFGG